MFVAREIAVQATCFKLTFYPTYTVWWHRTAHRFLIFTRELKSVAFVQFCAGPDTNCHDWNSRGFPPPLYANSAIAPLIKPQPLSASFPVPVLIPILPVAAVYFDKTTNKPKYTNFDRRTPIRSKLLIWKFSDLLDLAPFKFNSCSYQFIVMLSSFLFLSI